MESALKTEKPSTYEKQHSFKEVYSLKETQMIEIQQRRAVRIIQETIDGQSLESKKQQVIHKVLNDLSKTGPQEKADFYITRFIADEMERLGDDQLIRYLFHRYRYDIYPLIHISDDYPPYINIEPSSFCNYRCVFCYHSDPTFHRKSHGHMGLMTFKTYKKIIDQIENNVEFFSLASRGEPMLCKDIDQVLEYSVGKFLGMKLNTNASLLTEKHIHAILAGGVKTVVFSADAAEEELYGKIRVNGSLKRTVKKIELFQNIRAKHYPHSKIISRVSGVMINPEKQQMGEMEKFWGSLVDQVAFVKYNPWDMTYESEVNTITQPCSELWLRMFIWYNGEANPCENDYKSMLTLGNVTSKTISEIWTSDAYNHLRERHLNARRREIEPCKRCVVV
ncbi:MAG: SPASM domain-containing protein [SAR324 cluster bacterium]|nr:SPASM domain-containing protein [SAR324 cluster bacterium]